jgi:hypothetical protein
MKSYTDLEQSKRLAEILPLESADMYYFDNIPYCKYIGEDRDYWYTNPDYILAWSLGALLSLIKDKCGYFEFVYLKRTYDGRANPLEDVYRLSTDVYDVYNKDAIDACYEMILKLSQLNLL